MMEAELHAAGYPRDQIELIPDEQTAIDAGLRSAKRGDLLLVFADKISRSWKQVVYFKPEWAEKPASAPHQRRRARRSRPRSARASISRTSAARL